MSSSVSRYLSLVKFSHTVFALPFALVGFFMAVKMGGARVDWRLFALVLACMVFARSAAMAFNRWLDRDIDARNPRTAGREIPSGQIAASSALAFVALNCAGFVASSWAINPLCFALSPVALAVVLGYSYTKRFTWLCHLVLGVGLGLAPVGAFLAASGRFSVIPIMYGCAVALWTAGFDIIYALQDESFDRSQGLRSVPSFWGKAKALRLSGAAHVGTAGLMIGAGFMLSRELPGQLGVLHGLGLAVFLGLLVYQHSLVKPDDLSRVNMAFFTTNGLASVIFGALMVLDLMVF